jgi:hypothetical protein
MRAPYDRIFRLAAEVERWGEILPHYRYVKLLRRAEDKGFSTLPFGNEDDRGGGGVHLIEVERKLVKMSAWRNFIPVTWAAVQTVVPGTAGQPGRIHFRHVKGLVRGMKVVWSFHPRDDGEILVRITHDLSNPPMPVRILGPKLIETIVGQGFIGHIAGKTLKRIKELAESAE